MNFNESQRAALEAALFRLNQKNIDEDKKKLLLEHLYLVEEKNKVINLTRISDFESGVILHIEDSLTILPEFNETKGKFVDIGTGAGFPGLPLGIVTGRKGILLDSVKKKARAVQEFIDTLKIENLEAVGMRSEELAIQQPHNFGCVVARAVSSIPAVMELATPLLCKGGRVILMRANDTIDDLNNAKKVSQLLGLNFISKREFTIGQDSTHRSVLVFERVGKSNMKLPRRPGMASKQPLI